MNDTQNGTLLISNVCYGMADEKPLLLDILQPQSRPKHRIPAIMELHTGAWTYGEKDAERNRLFAEHGFFTVSINYRLSGEATFPAQIDDAKTAVRWLRTNAEKFGIDSEHIGVWGLSAGGHLASLLGLSADRITPEDDEISCQDNSAKVQAVATISGPTDIVHLNGKFEHLLLGGTVPERMKLAHLASPIDFVKEDAPPFLIIHGTLDDLVPFQQAELLYDKLCKVRANVTFIPIEGGDHMALFNNHKNDIMQSMLDFFTKYLF